MLRACAGAAAVVPAPAGVLHVRTGQQQPRRLGSQLLPADCVCGCLTVAICNRLWVGSMVDVIVRISLVWAQTQLGHSSAPSAATVPWSWSVCFSQGPASTHLLLAIKGLRWAYDWLPGRLCPIVTARASVPPCMTLLLRCGYVLCVGDRDDAMLQRASPQHGRAQD